MRAVMTLKDAPAQLQEPVKPTAKTKRHSLYKALDSAMLEYGYDRTGLIPTLHQAQEMFGYISKSAMRYIATRMGVPLSHVYGTASFYSHFNLSAPSGKHQITVCTGTCCHLNGSACILRRLKKMLHFEDGKGHDEGRWELKTVRCTGSCSAGPVMLVNDELFTKLDPDSAVSLLNEFE